MKSFRRSLFGGLALLFLGQPSSASAHFVWIETAAEGDRLAVRSGFGEMSGWDPDLVDRMKDSQFWTRGAGGLQPLAVAVDEKEKEYRTTVEGTKPTTVLAATNFGVIQFGASPPSWLRYTAKNLVGEPKTWGDDQPTKDLRIELLASLDADRVTLKALHLGKPLAGAKIKGENAKGESVELTTDEQGVAHWPMVGAGRYACYVGTTTKTGGELNGKKYDVLKDYTTLTFTIPAGK